MIEVTTCPRVISRVVTRLTVMACAKPPRLKAVRNAPQCGDTG